MRITDKDREVIRKILSLEKTNNRQKIFTKQEEITKKLIGYIKEGAEDEVQEDNSNEF